MLIFSNKECNCYLRPHSTTFVFSFAHSVLQILSSPTMAFVALQPVTCHFSRSFTGLCALQMSAQPNKGFGKKPSSKPPRIPSQGEKRRKVASDRYDQMAAAGLPEYTVWMRLKKVPDAPSVDGDESEHMPWLPVGCISVPRSSQVANAIFDAEEDVLQGATRMYPTLQNQPRDNIEFGYQLREFDDEEIKVAEKESDQGIQGALRKWFRAWQNPMNAAT